MRLPDLIVNDLYLPKGLGHRKLQLRLGRSSLICAFMSANRLLVCLLDLAPVALSVRRYV